MAGRLVALPRASLDLLGLLHGHGHGAWLTGGTARDLCQGRIPPDLDLCTSATPAEVRRLLPPHWLPPEQPGEPLGSFAVSAGQVAMELTSLRREAGYADGRKPDRVWFTDRIDEDWARRDFTVNALYLDTRTCSVSDPSGRGLADLEARRLCCIGDPATRFREDSLRVLRALRLAAEHDLVMDLATWEGLRRAADAVQGLSPTRTRDELQRLLTARGRARGLMLFVASGAAAHLVPDLPPLAEVPQPADFHPEGDVLRHTAQVLANLPEPVDERLAWAAIFHDVAKKDCMILGPDRIRFDGHDVLSARRARGWLREHGASVELTDDVVEVVGQHIRIASVPSFRPAKQHGFLSDPRFRLHLAFHRADCLACHRQLGIWQELRRLASLLTPTPPAPLLRGRDLIAMGLPPGPAIGRLLEAVRDAQLAGQVRTVDEARRLAAELRDGPQDESGPHR